MVWILCSQASRGHGVHIGIQESLVSAMDIPETCKTKPFWRCKFCPVWMIRHNTLQCYKTSRMSMKIPYSALFPSGSYITTSVCYQWWMLL